MQRALLPLVLTSLGFVIFVFAATSMPLFEWQISEFTEDFPPTYAVDHLSSPWIAQLGDTFDDGRYVHSKVFVSKDKQACLAEDRRFVIRRSSFHETLEKLSLNSSQSVSWVSVLGLIEILLAGIYIWWFLLSIEQRPISNAVTATIVAGVYGCCLTNVFVYAMKVASGMPHYYLGLVDCYQGTIAFSASLSKVHYETVLALSAGIFLFLGAATVMIQQIRRAIMQRNETAEPAVG